jgi:hypothetical protein
MAGIRKPSYYSRVDINRKVYSIIYLSQEVSEKLLHEGCDRLNNGVLGETRVVHLIPC